MHTKNTTHENIQKHKETNGLNKKENIEKHRDAKTNELKQKQNTQKHLRIIENMKEIQNENIENIGKQRSTQHKLENIETQRTQTQLKIQKTLKAYKFILRYTRHTQQTTPRITNTN